MFSRGPGEEIEQAELQEAEKFGAREERAKIVAWLRDTEWVYDDYEVPAKSFAMMITRGDHDK